MTGSRSSRTRSAPTARLRAGAIALGVGGFVFAGKLAAYAATGSSAVLSDAMESVVNVAAGALLLLSLVISARPPDRDHPYGHGKVELFSAAIEGTLVVVAAVVIAVEAIGALWRGPVLHRLDLGLLLLTVFAVVNGLLGAYLLRVGRSTRSPALMADARHVLTDVWTTAGVVVGLAGVWLTGWLWLDPVVALAVAANIVREGWRLAREAVLGLLDTSDEAALEQITSALETHHRPEWIDVHGLRAWGAGDAMHVDFHMQVPRYWTAEQLHAIHEGIERLLAAQLGAAGSLVVHFDPCRPTACSDCSVPECPVRAADPVRRIAITLETATREDPEEARS